MSVLDLLPKEYHTLPFHHYLTKIIHINALSKGVEAIIWHQHFVHYGPHYMYQARAFADGVPNPSKFDFDNVLKCSTYLKMNLTKSFVEYKNFRGTI